MRKLITVLALILFGCIAQPALACSTPTAPEFIISGWTASEGQTETFTIAKSKAYDKSSRLLLITVNGSAKSGTDYRYTKTYMTFLPNQMTVHINVPTYARAGYQGDRQFSAILYPVQSACVSGGDSALAFIKDTDAAPPQFPDPAPSPVSMGIATAISACPAQNRTSSPDATQESLEVGRKYNITGYGGYAAQGDYPPEGTKDVVILSDATHPGDGIFALWVDKSCVTVN
jgi:hypothetical protein